MSFASEWAEAEPLPELPAHPRCRCTIRAVYRGADGKVYSTTIPAHPEPETPPQGVVAQAEQVELTRLQRLDQLQDAAQLGGGANTQPALLANSWAEVDGAAKLLIGEQEWTAAKEARDYWRSVDFTPDLMAEVARLQPTFDGALALRYGVRVTSPDVKRAAAFDEAQRLRILQGVESVRSLVPRYVEDSDRFLTFNLNYAGTNALASCSNFGTITYDSVVSAKYVTKDLRIAPGQAVEEIIVHEIGHSIANRYGEPAYGGQKSIVSYGRPGSYSRPLEGATNGTGVTEAPTGKPGQSSTYNPTPEQVKFFDEWVKIRRKTSRFAPPNVAARASYELELEQARQKIKLLTDDVQAIRERLDAIRPPGTPSGDPWTPEQARLAAEFRAAQSQVTFWVSHADTFKRRLAEIETAAAEGPGDYHVSDYGRMTPWEDFAESWAMYVLNPKKLLELSPKRYEFMKRIAEGNGG